MSLLGGSNCCLDIVTMDTANIVERQCFISWPVIISGFEVPGCVGLADVEKLVDFEFCH